MKNFKDFKIASQKRFEGKSIEIEQVFNIPIIIYDYTIGPSKTKPGTECLTLQIGLENDKRIIWTGSSVLIDDIKKIPEDGFPFTTTIVKQNRFFKFT